MFWSIWMYLPAWTMTGSGCLAQASTSRLGEISSNSPKLLERTVTQATSASFEREPISLRQGGLAYASERNSATVPDSSPRLSERDFSPERGSSTWAKGWLRSMYVDGFLCSWMLNTCMNCLCLSKYELSGFAWIRWMMNCDSWVLTWYDYAFGMRWFMELKWCVGMDLAWDMSEGCLMNMAWCQYETHSYFHGLRLVNERYWHGIQRRMELPRLAWDIYVCVLNNYLFDDDLVCGQCVIPWDP